MRHAPIAIGPLLALLAVVAAGLSPVPARAQEAADPRLELASLRLAGRTTDALVETRRLLGSEPRAAAWGLDYLKGRLLEDLGRHEEASEAFAAALSRTPLLAKRARLRLAESQERLGHPEVAAGLLASLLAEPAARSIAAPATDLLLSAIEGGGDCRLLGKAGRWPLADAERRLVTFARADCAATSDEPESARQLLDSLLEESTSDGAARLAADRLDALAPLERSTTLRVGLTFHEHREFDRATRHLALALADDDGRGRLHDAEYDSRYALARSLFWRGLWDEAADLFANLAARASDPERTARARYQQARALELAGDWDGAGRSFGLAWEAEPAGQWSGAAVLSAFRLRWRSGKEEAALALYEQLGRERRWRESRRRAALFLASSDIVRGRFDRAAAWLADADGGDDDARVELAFWRGRLAELEGDATAAVARYLEALLADPYHPVAQEAAARLAAPPLAPAAAIEAARLSQRGQTDDLYRAWLLLRGSPAAIEVGQRLLSRLAASPRLRPYLAIGVVPPERWRLWSAPGDDEEEVLVRAGLWGEAEAAVRRHFPSSDPDLALTASTLLAADGRPQRSVYLAEVLRSRVPRDLPEAFLPAALRRLLYPLPWSERIAKESIRQGIQPGLLAAVIREESRFDTDAVSAAQARGLTQFVFPTARRLANEIGLGAIDPRDLGTPAISIALGAAYLAQLEQRFQGHVPMALAAYNAGEPQADLWRVYCYSLDPAEYYTKVGFTETRGYLRKVLSSWAQYREVYATAG